MTAAVRVESVSKRYILRHERFRSFQQMAIDFVTHRPQPVEEFWALRDIGFEVAPGETFGIIGANGSGKSTLLKLIARVISPTRGQIETAGRVAALIELGAGFHPELTGRENVFLHGSFLGLTRRQMQGRYDQIIDFAELAQFVDTPLKHYSSGMMMRLGFATAIAVDADVLIIDEVLAVGDMRFQRKCLDALHEFKQAGGTILLVAQDVGTVRRFCDRALLLSHGRAVAYGRPIDVVSEYVYGDLDFAATGTESSDTDDAPATRRRPAALDVPGGTDPAGPAAEILGLRIYNRDGHATEILVSGDPMRIEIDYLLREPFDRIIAGIQFVGEGEEYLYGTAADDLDAPATAGRHRIAVNLPSCPFVGGRVLICVGLADSVSETGYHHVAYRDRKDSFHVLPVSMEGGWVRLPLQWSVLDTSAESPLVGPRSGQG
jgi:ABC-type polysaccharide/polyol phosphate transport system ATPase subunit